jgi:selT/selW/selH-like putative selenoprotein
LAAELTHAFATPVGGTHPIAGIVLEPSRGGVFDIFVNGKLVFSKAKTHRHPNPGEIVSLMSAGQPY